MIQPLPHDMGHFDYIIHAAGIASPIYYRAQPLKCIDANINGLRNLLDYAVAEREAGRPVRGFLFYSSSEIYGDPLADAIPTPGDLSRQRVVHRPARLLRRVQALRRDALRRPSRSTHGMPVKIARPFNNYGPGLKITDGRVHPGLRPDVLAGRDIVMFSDGSPKRTFCYATDAITGYYKVLVRGGNRRALQRRHRTAGDLDGRARAASSSRPRSELFGYQGKVVLGKAAGSGLPGRQPEPPLPGHRQGARAARLRAAGARRRRRLPLAGLVPPQSSRRQRPDADLDRRHRLCRPRHRAPAWRSAATTSTCVDLDPAKVDSDQRGPRPDPRGRACRSCSSARRQAAARHDRPAARGRRLGRHVHRGRARRRPTGKHRSAATSSAPRSEIGAALRDEAEAITRSS